MTGWMFLLMGLLYQKTMLSSIGGILVIVCISCIRTQFLITENQYKLGMIPHHSMAIHMSKKLLQKENTLSEFANTVIKTQESEIKMLKSLR